MVAISPIDEFAKLEDELELLFKMIDEQIKASDIRDVQMKETARSLETQMRLVSGTAHRVSTLIDNTVKGAETGLEQSASTPSEPVPEGVTALIPAAIVEIDKMMKEMDLLLEMSALLHAASGDSDSDDGGPVAHVETQMRLIAGTAHRVKALVNHVVPIEEICQDSTLGIDSA